jgi:acetoin utilization protein AcuC
VPDRLPEEAAAVLAGLRWSRRPQPARNLLTTLADPPREGPVRRVIHERLEVLERR